MLTEGLPNSVVFDFDASAAGDRDSIFISQTWDTRRKELVNKNDKHYSSIYYYPGYFRAKLMIGNEIVREHDIQIKTDGWLGLIEAEWGKEPLYFKKEEITRQNEIAIDEPLLKKYNIKQYYFHGIGLAVQFDDNTSVDFDFAFLPEQRHDGFDLWRLSLFVASHPNRYKKYLDKKKLEAEFNKLIDRGAILNLSPTSSLYFFKPAPTKKDVTKQEVIQHNTQKKWWKFW